MQKQKQAASLQAVPPQQAPAESNAAEQDWTLTATVPLAISASTIAANACPRQHSLSEPMLLTRLAVSCREAEVARAEAPTVTLLACMNKRGLAAECLQKSVEREA